jgi:hypothetical protein
VAEMPVSAPALHWWKRLVRYVAASVWRDFRRHPIGLGVRVLSGYCLVALVSLANVVPSWILYGYHESGWLKSAPVLAAASIARIPAVSLGWQLVAGPFAIGLAVAWYSRRHELSVCCGLVVFLTALRELVRLSKGEIDLWTALAVLTVPARYLALFPGAILVRYVRLRQMQRRGQRI